MFPFPASFVGRSFHQELLPIPQPKRQSDWKMMRLIDFAHVSFHRFRLLSACQILPRPWWMELLARAYQRRHRNMKIRIHFWGRKVGFTIDWNWAWNCVQKKKSRRRERKSGRLGNASNCCRKWWLDSFPFLLSSSITVRQFHQPKFRRYRFRRWILREQLFMSFEKFSR